VSGEWRCADVAGLQYVPTVFDNYEAEILVEGQNVKFSLWDTAGQEGYSRIRTLSYPKTDIFLVCFSVVKHTSFDNVAEKWCPELHHHCPNVPMILVGTQIDLREDEKTLKDLAKLNKEPITPEQGKAKARTIKVRERERLCVWRVMLTRFFFLGSQVHGVLGVDAPGPQGRV
jgi:small GTP-binding protein